MYYIVDDSIAHSVIFTTCTGKSLDSGGEVPEPWESWVDEVLTAASNAAEEAAEHVTAIIQGLIAPEYDPENGTYEVGDYVIYNNAVYQCITAVTEPEEWDATKWEEVSFLDSLAGLSEDIDALEEGKVDKVEGKGLSTEDYTTAEKEKLHDIEAGAQVNTVTGVKGDSESSYRIGNVNITKANIGLGNVDNTRDADKPVSAPQQAALDLKIPLTQKGAASGVAELDSAGKVPSSQLPSYVDDVVEYASLSAFPATGETGKIYIALDTNKTYRWSGSAYVEISASLALGETSSTAFRGDRGKTAYNNSNTNKTNIGTLADLTTTNKNNLVEAINEVNTKAADGEAAQEMIADEFNTSINYEVGEYVRKDGVLYLCTTDHSAGAWDSNHFAACNVGEELTAQRHYIDAYAQVSSDTYDALAPGFTTAGRYDIGDYVTHNGKLYRCITAIAVPGAWAGANWEEVKVGNELTTQSRRIDSVTTDTTTVTGNPITIQDGVDGMPVRDLKVTMQPIQDLHGYDHPWPAGGGTNIFDPYSYFIDRTASGLTSEIMSDGTIHISGTATAENRYGTSTRFDFPAGTYIVVGTPQQVIARDANGIISNNGVFTVDGETPIYFSVKVTNGGTYDFYEKIQLNTGSDAIDWTPYENICPISGHTSANVTRAGKNLMRYPYSEGSATVRTVTYTPQSDGSILINGTATGGTSAYSLYKSTSPLYIPNGNYVFTTEYEGTISNNAYVRFTTEAGGAYTELSFGDSANVTIDHGALYLSFRFPSGAAATNAIVRPMLRLASGSDATWEAYKGTTYSITFPVAAGTVYGGELDVTTGELMVTWAAMDMGTVYWQKTNDYAYRSNDYLTPRKKAGITNIICDSLKTINQSSASNMPNYVIKGRSSDGSVFIKTTSDMTEEEYNTYFSGKYMAYELATPVDYHLTPIEVTLLLATNNLWCDGNTTLTMKYGEYLTASVDHADMQSRLVKALIAPVLDSMTADTALSANDFRIVGNTLYRITASVASGGTLTPGTNCTATTIGAEITAILNS